MALNVFVMVPRAKVVNGILNGYRIGEYPKTAFKGLSVYKPPPGFIEVTPENEDTSVSPHFTLKQFLCKQADGHPKYVVLRERLLLKLELVLQETNAGGFRSDTLHVMSGYCTPYFNKAIGNVKYSRHVFGGAADVFIDASPVDGVMDDLNGDGRLDVRDAAVLYDIVDRLYGEERYDSFVGGLGQYRETPAHGAFVHVEVRGFRARWGR
ncbi:MAG: D-Ala-D-Ala carboxypeptidase family metallohydrolase [Thermoleophilia bacterium]|nr:D-Ala-D-Ala carboxypeptidase family metallohydrolase [Thermoleophilia bacterium]